MTFTMFVLLLPAMAVASEVSLTTDTAIRFAAPADAKGLLVADDSFTASLSRFDLQCRLKTSKDVTLADYRAFVVQHARAWSPDEVAAVTSSLERLRDALRSLRLPLPPVIHLVRTTGDEEGGAAYTRGNTIVLPNKVLNYPPTQLDRLLAHEIFHILSRHDGALRAKLYRIIGFEVCEPIELPPKLAPRRITNPDAPLVDCVISITAKDGKVFTGAPVLYSATEYDPQRGQSLFQSLVFRMLVVEQRSGRWQPLLKSGEPVVINVREEAAYLDQIGKNTNYIIHPDEILADNFVRLVMQDLNVPTPRIIDDMRRVLAN